ncbi:aldehyde dehydrogenase [Blastococcus sp. URHD0036]|uniref:aldehyde dehydrogenase family protein n=1 Tax=Blastococcus sp. URHD0036 TaxID=1380356 RepID=UPI0004951EEF|nr:aldehyde dehydrogenase family protein [Blastococcus sp. URHD0036]
MQDEQLTDGATTARFPDFPADAEYGLLINGQSVPAMDGSTFACVDPFEDREWGVVASGSAADVDLAVSSARAAFERWRSVSPGNRARILLRWAALIEQHAEELARLQVHENGKTITEMQGASLGTAAAASFYASLAANMHGETFESPLPRHRAWTVREPIGVVGAITPWNNPLVLLSWKLFPALAAGNTIVIKPSEVTPLSTLRLAQLGLEAGLPDGVVNVVMGAGAAGKALAEHPDVDKLAFTGSTATGRAIALAGAARFAHVTLELGGKGPHIVFPDANLDRAVEGLVTGLTAGTGQACNAGSRVLVHADIHDEVIERVGRRLSELRVGDPLDPETEIGPLASRPQLAKVTSYFDISREEGHRLVTGGQRASGDAALERGLFVEPTLYAGVDNRSRLAQEEIFGPVGAAMSFTTDEEAVRLANDIPYGLTAGFWTKDVDRVHRLSGQLRAGTVWVNTWRVGGLQLPFGGMKASGVGREMGLNALDAYTETKSVWLGLDS